MSATRAGSGAGLEQLQALYGVGAAGSRSDAELIEAFLCRPTDAAEGAFAALVERHGPMVLGTCLRILGDRHAAEDAFQATFLVLAARARTIRSRESIGGWLHRVARRVAVRSERAARRRRSVEVPLTVEVAAMDDGRDGPDRAELRAVIDAEIDRLGEPQRQAVVLCDLEGLTDEQAAARLGWPVGTVKSRLSRARSRLRSRLLRRGIAPAALAGAGSLWSTKAATAAVRPALARGLVAAATAWASGHGAAGSVPAGVTSLARGEIKQMLLLKLKLAATAVAGASMLTAGLALTGPGRPAPGGDGSAVGPEPVAVADPPDSDEDDDALTLSAAGCVVDPDGQPIAGATVIVREWAVRRTGVLTPEQREEFRKTDLLDDILARGRTDADGRFRFEGVAARPFSEEDNRYLGKSFFPWDLVVLADGHAVAWVPLTAHHQRAPLTIALVHEATISGRVVEPDGSPIAGGSLRVAEIAPLDDEDVREFETSDRRIDLSWSSVPLEATSGDDGRFVLGRVPTDRRVLVVARAPGHQRAIAYVATTDRPQPDLVDETFHSGRREVKNIPIATGDLTVTMKPTDHRLIGRLVFASTGEPAVGATVLNGFERIDPTDADGRFEVTDLAAGTIVLHALADGTDAAPLDVEVEIPEGEQVVERTFALPRGLIVTGRVVDEASGAGVEGARLRYQYQPEGEGIPTLFGLMAETDAEGAFRLVVPAGRGVVELYEAPEPFLGPGSRAIGTPPESRFSRPVEGSAGDRVADQTFALERGHRVAFRAVGPDGEPIEGAELRRYAFPDRGGPIPRTDAEGLGAVDGIMPDAPYSIDIVHPALKLGRRVELNPSVDREPAAPIAVELAPLGAVEGRVLDEDGEPLVGPVLQLRTNVRTPEQYGIGVESRNEVEPDGSFRFDDLVPGGTYYVEARVDGHAASTSTWFEAGAGAVERLDPFRLPVTDRALTGVVVDPRGMPVADATVSYQSEGSYQSNPLGRWFTDTGADGRFRLDVLPRGRLELMAYRNPEGPDRSITNQVRVHVEPGQDEIRIELPDRRRRLQGIED